ncbi:FAD-binding oxidoreductase [Rhizobium sp. BK251]|uniref:NAD(P)/FAD-dependent oxidoreductase n=1 Tax=Rhizobium sp. BK251 TaxID=2512125 RepID=UPI001047F0AC|nr:FAD-binding oxidoreductase [Rhizobium sp. BK251]TCL74631.1 glycine oxidase [Rhizobium sp. BK251]
MERADNPAAPPGQSSIDLLIVGGGIMGLWAAVHAERAGLNTVLFDAAALGSGASGGLLGALMPHMPDRWSEKKQFQFEALVSLEAEIAALEAATGLSAGYRRSGRIVPLPKPHLRRIAEGHSRDAEAHWRHGERRFHWHLRDEAPVGEWVDPASGESGFVHDTLAARVAPRSLTAVLAAFLRNARHVRIVEGTEVLALDAGQGIARTSTGDIRFGRCIVAAGYRSFPLLDAMTPGLQVPLGQPVKGQAALLKAEVDPDLPVMFRDGLYIVPHEGGHVAVGSTSEDSFAEPFTTDERLDALVAAARALAPCLGHATVVERWAGLRPKAIDRDPMVGPHPDNPGLIALTGGFKVSFGLAHRLAAAAIGLARDEPDAVALPRSFSLANHIAVASHKS